MSAQGNALRLESSADNAALKGRNNDAQPSDQTMTIAVLHVSPFQGYIASSVLDSPGRCPWADMCDAGSTKLTALSSTLRLRVVSTSAERLRPEGSPSKGRWRLRTKPGWPKTSLEIWLALRDTPRSRLAWEGAGCQSLSTWCLGSLISALGRSSRRCAPYLNALGDFEKQRAFAWPGRKSAARQFRPERGSRRERPRIAFDQANALSDPESAGKPNPK